MELAVETLRVGVLVKAGWLYRFALVLRALDGGRCLVVECF
jgi:hypothetical protein